MIASFVDILRVEPQNLERKEFISSLNYLHVRVENFEISAPGSQNQCSATELHPDALVFLDQLNDLREN